MDAPLKNFLKDLERLHEMDADSRQACLSRAAVLSQAAGEEFAAALSVIRRLATREDSPLDDATLDALLSLLPRRPLSAPEIDQIADCFRVLSRRSDAGSAARDRSRARLLHLLASAGSPAALAAFAELVVADPPRDALHADLAFVPLFQNRDLPADALFPRLLDALQSPATAALVLDLANHLARTGRVDPHPAADRAEQLIGLLGNVVDRLRRLEERPAEFGASPAELRQVVATGTPLVVSLCDALGWIGDERAIGKLTQALELGHRRLRTEAAAALARLGDKRGKETLIDLTAQPVARPRALAYLDELGLLDDVPAARRSPAARAEGEFADWLARPQQFGIGPQSLLLVDERRQRWPGYSEPVDCYLFDFEYHLPQGDLTGVGIAGPVLHCLSADLSDLPPADIYAAYAGWCAEHDEIRETEAADLPLEARQRFAALAARLPEQGYLHPQLVKRGEFFGDELWVATAERAGVPGVVVLEGPAAHWFPAAASRRPIGPTEAYYIVKGRKLLQVFNP